MGAVLPATVLRGDSSTEWRRYLLSNFRISCIIIRDDKRNFSEDTQFQEVLLIASKSEERSNFIDYIIIHHLDSHLSDDISLAISSTSHNGDFDFGSFIHRRVSTNDIDISNLFRPVSVSDARILRLLDRLHDLDVMEPLGNIATDIRSKDQAEPRLGPTFSRFSLNERHSTHNRSDSWQVVNSLPSSFVVRNLQSGDEVEVPNSSLARLFRRIPYRGKMNVTPLEEFVVKERFDGFERFSQLSGVRSVQWTRWQDYLSSRTSNLAIADRLDVSAPGTRLLSYVDEKSRVWARIPASVSGISIDDAKILCLWFNSTFGVLEAIVERMPTRGAYLQLHAFILKTMPVIDPRRLPSETRMKLLAVYGELCNVEFPSLREQFARLVSDVDAALRSRVKSDFPDDAAIHMGEGFYPREHLDKTILECLGFGSDAIRETMSWIYRATLETILMLYELMEGANSIDEMSVDG